MTPTVSSDDLFEAIRVVVLDVLPAGIEVVQAQVNRVPEVKGEDYVLMTPGSRNRLATTEEAYDWEQKTVELKQSVAATVQLDIHGPNSEDNAQVLGIVFRSSVGVKKFSAFGAEMAPLSITEPQQVPFVNAENEYETRWVLKLDVQLKPAVVIAEEFAFELDVGVKEVDAAYPVSA